MNKRSFWIIAAVIVAIVGFFVLTQPKEDSAATPSNHTYGEGKSGVTLIEYGDFQCPACGSYFPVLKQLKEEYKEQIFFQFRHFPLKAIHQNALASSRAAEAADKQGKFWEMHDKLFEGQQVWESSSNPMTIFEGYASSIGLDLAKYKLDYASSAINDIITADEKEAQKLGLQSTPTFIVDGKKVEENPRDYDGFKKLIDDAIAAKQ